MVWKVCQSDEEHGIQTKSGRLYVVHQAFKFKGSYSFSSIYVDDIIMMRNNRKERQTLKQCLINEFEIKELGWLKCFLGIEVAHSK